MKPLLKIGIHLVLWVSFILVVITLVPKPHFREDLPLQHFPPFLSLLFPALAIFYYLNSIVLIPQLLARQKRNTYLLALSGCFMAVLAIPYVEHDILVPHAPPLPRPIQTIQVLLTMLLFFMVLVVGSGVKIVYNWYAAQERQKEIEFEKTTTELSFLKSQINPHFLFNTLNNIYTLSVLRPEQASDAILKLSDLMRYVFTDSSQTEVPVQEELNYLEKFVDLQKIRLTSNVVVDFKVFGKPGDEKIPPLLLLPIIENAFKYGASTHEASLIQIHVHIKPEEVVLEARNPIFSGTNEHVISTGIGLQNVKRRLQLLYPHRHWLKVETVESVFAIDLHILI